MDGFRQLGWEIVPYANADPVRDPAPDEIVVGHVAAVRAGLRALGLPVPPELGYPDALRPFLGRQWQSTSDTVAAQPESWPVFVKPAQNLKKFTGVPGRPRGLRRPAPQCAHVVCRVGAISGRGALLCALRPRA